jgi:hypothetical protein
VQIAGLTDPYDHSLPPSGPASLPAAQDQLEWVESILKTSNATWLIVAGHYPVWSVAEHGPTQILVEQLRPMLEKYNATAYLCGHDHTLQHICEEDSTVEYYVSGAGHLTDSSMAHEVTLKYMFARAIYLNMHCCSSLISLKILFDSIMLHLIPLNLMGDTHCFNCHLP